MRCAETLETNEMLPALSRPQYQNNGARSTRWQALYGTGEFVLLGRTRVFIELDGRTGEGVLFGKKSAPSLCIKLCSTQDNSAAHGHGLPSLFSPLPLKLRFAMRLPQGLRPVPHRQHNAETYDRTDHSEREAIIYGLGIHFLPPLPLPESYSVHRPDQTTDQRANGANAAAVIPH
jgi:hypothetical protein